MRSRTDLYMLLVLVEHALDLLDIGIEPERLERRDDMLGSDRLLLVLLARVVRFRGDQVDELWRAGREGSGGVGRNGGAGATPGLKEGREGGRGQAHRYSMR